MDTTTIHNALLVVLIDSGISLDGTNVLDLLHRAEDNVLIANYAELSGNFDQDGNITPNGRRNILHTERDSLYVDSLLVVAQAARGTGSLFV